MCPGIGTVCLLGVESFDFLWGSARPFPSVPVSSSHFYLCTGKTRPGPQSFPELVTVALLVEYNQHGQQGHQTLK